MKQVSITVVDMRNGKASARMVPGRAVSISGFEDQTFILHRNLRNPKLWTVSEATTGARIDDGWTQREAISESTVKLARFGRTMFLDHLARNREYIAAHA